MGWSDITLKDAYVGIGKTSQTDLVLQIEVDDEYFPPSSFRLTLTPEQVEKLDQEIQKWKKLNRRG